MRIILLCILALSACSEPATSSGCTSNDDCQPGEACINDDCTTLCSSDQDCATGTICENDTCVTGERTDSPVIESIDADGYIDTDASHVGHRITSHLTILGEHFDGAGVSLSDGNSTWDLELCTAASDRLVVAMPTDLVAGTYVLNVASQAGACDAQLPVLQGEAGLQGIAGSPGAQGPVGPPGPIFTGTGAAGAIVSSLTVSARGDCGGEAPVEHMAVYLNQALAAEFDVSNATFADFTVPISTPIYADEIAVAFTNDNQAGGCDHNLHIQQIVINGTTTIASTDTASAIVDRGAYFDRVDVLPAQTTLANTGALRFFIGYAAPRRAPRGIYTPDTRTGCPPTTNTAGDVLISQSFAVGLSSVVHINAHIISTASGRRDAVLAVDDVVVTHDLLRTEVADWAEHELFWVGELASGAHTIELRAATTGAGYGCESGWGSIGTLVFEP